MLTLARWFGYRLVTVKRAWEHQLSNYLVKTFFSGINSNKNTHTYITFKYSLKCLSIRSFSRIVIFISNFSRRIVLLQPKQQFYRLTCTLFHINNKHYTKFEQQNILSVEIVFFSFRFYFFRECCRSSSRYYIRYNSRMWSVLFIGYRIAWNYTLSALYHVHLFIEWCMLLVILLFL